MADSTTGADVVVVSVTPETAARMAAKFWWVMLVAGIVSLGFGIWMVFEPVHAARTVAVVLGIWLAIVGIAELVHAASARERGAAIASGVVLLVLGIVLIAKPDLPIKVVAIIWGIAILLAGLMRIVLALVDRSYGWGWRMVLGFIGVVLGLVIVAWPTATVGVVFVVAGLCAILTGLVWIVTSFSLRRAPERLAAGSGQAPF